MQRTRPFTTQSLYGMGFIVIVLFIILGISFTYVFLVCAPRLPDTWFTVFVHYLLFINLMAAFYQCVMTDPGLVPPNWGFYMGDETKRRRYCKMCNVWKPDRTHHCSICNRCILNMDHHCPWINNCVGFFNRKFFIQLLLYVYVTLVIIVLTTFPTLFSIFSEIIPSPTKRAHEAGFIVSAVLVTMMQCMSALLICTLTNFIKFHLKLVLENYTTIENLEREEGAKSKFDIGRRRNWEQVFGANPWLWWCPAHTKVSRPVGDGARWRVHYTRVIDEDEELPAEENGARK